MEEFILIPTFLALLVVTYTDIRYRRVPRVVIGSGLGTQLVCLIVLSAVTQYWDNLIMSIVCMLVCTTLQYVLALIRPGALGLGDVTATALITFALGWLGLIPVLLWWLYSGICGLIQLVVAHIRHHTSIPFVPAMTLSFCASVLTQILMVG